MNDGYQDFATNFLTAVDFVALIRNLKTKSNTKLWPDIDVLNYIQNCNNQYEIFKQSSKDIDEDDFKCAKFLIKKILIIKTKLYFEGKSCRKRKILQNSWELFFIEKKKKKKILEKFKVFTYAIYKGKQSKIPFSPNAGKYGPGKTPYLDTFHAVIKRE